MRRRKLEVLLCVLFSLIGCSKKSDGGGSLDGGNVTIFEPSGTWNYSGISEDYNPGNCGFPSNPYATVNGQFIIVRNGQVVSGTDGTVSYIGAFANNDLEMTSQFLLNGWTINQYFDGRMDSANTFDGILDWTARAGQYNCSGTLNISASRQ